MISGGPRLTFAEEAEACSSLLGQKRCRGVARHWGPRNWVSLYLPENDCVEGPASKIWLVYQKKLSTHPDTDTSVYSRYCDKSVYSQYNSFDVLTLRTVLRYISISLDLLATMT